MSKRKWQALCLLGVMAVLLVSSAAAGEAVRRALSLCARSVVPALFPFFVVSGLFTSLGFAEGMGRRLTPAAALLFRVSGAGASAFFLGLLGGYPVGGRTVGQLYREGRISCGEAERLLSFCNNAGPSFILGVVGLGCFQSLTAGWALYFIHAVSAVLVGVLLRRKRRPKPGLFPPQQLPEKILPAFIRSVQDSALAMLRVCGFVVFALVVQALVTEWTGVSHPAALGFIELTGGVMRLGSGRTDFVWAAALLGWGGLSVHGQTAAVLADTNLKMGRYFLGKLLQAALSALLAYLLVFCWYSV